MTHVVTPQFLNPPDGVMPAKARVAVISAPYEATVSYGGGTAAGPAAIIEASAQVELFDEEFAREAYTVGVQTYPPIDFGSSTGAAAVALVDHAVSAALARGEWPLVLGGEHTLTTGCVRACLRTFPALGVLQIDAHGDLRAAYEDTPWSHACVMRRIVELGCPTVGVGLRSICPEEYAFITERKLPRWFAHDMCDSDFWMERAIAELPDDIFLTFDVDGIDPSLIRATGTPEPGGLTWHQTLKFLRKVFAAKRVVGADLVELAPRADDHASSFAVARLAYKMIGYWVASERK